MRKHDAEQNPLEYLTAPHDIDLPSRFKAREWEALSADAPSLWKSGEAVHPRFVRKGRDGRIPAHAVSFLCEHPDGSLRAWGGDMLYVGNGVPVTCQPNVMYLLGWKPDEEDPSYWVWVPQMQRLARLGALVSGSGASPMEALSQVGSKAASWSTEGADRG